MHVIMKLRFPVGDFTIADLEVANPMIPSIEVRVSLAEAISNRSVGFVQNGEQVPMTYRRVQVKPQW
jgi:hypothetical protein